MSNSGYAGQILRVDLSTGKIELTPTSDYADRFLAVLNVRQAPALAQQCSNHAATDRGANSS